MATNKQREISTADLPMAKPSDLLLGDDFERGGELLAQADGLTMDHADALEFMEQPIKIQLAKKTGKNAGQTVPCWVNGQAAEVFNPNTRRWMPLGYLPCGVPIITKRKYVEVLARAKEDAIATAAPDAGDKEMINRVERSSSQKHPLNVIVDNDPRGADWLAKIVYEA